MKSNRYTQLSEAIKKFKKQVSALGSPVIMPNLRHFREYSDSNESYMKIDHSLPIDERFSDAEEAALWLEEQGLEVNQGKIKLSPTKYGLNRIEREIIKWMEENGYEWIGHRGMLEASRTQLGSFNSDLISEYERAIRRNDKDYYTSSNNYVISKGGY